MTDTPRGAAYWLWEQEQAVGREIERLTTQIEDLEREIVGARGKRGDLRLVVVEMNAARGIIERSGLKVERLGAETVVSVTPGEPTMTDTPNPDPEYHEHVAGDEHAHPFNGQHSHGGVSALRSPTMPDTPDRMANEIVLACAEREPILDLIRQYGDARVAAHIDALTASGRAWMAEQMDHDHPMTEAEERLMRLFSGEPHDA